MIYETIFDVTAIGYRHWDILLFSMIMVIVGGQMVIRQNRKSIKISKFHRFYVIFFISMSLAIVSIIFISSFRQYMSAVDIVKSERAQIIEGVVTNFRPMPWTGGGKRESFCVVETCFEYSDYHIVAGFNNTAVFGGPMRDGLHVRITYFEDLILKLEIAK